MREYIFNGTSVQLGYTLIQRQLDVLENTQIKNTQNTQIKYNSEYQSANNTKYSKTKSTLVQLPFMTLGQEWCGHILQCSWAHTGHKIRKCHAYIIYCHLHVTLNSSHDWERLLNILVAAIVQKSTSRLFHSLIVTIRLARFLVFSWLYTCA